MQRCLHGSTGIHLPSTSKCSAIPVRIRNFCSKAEKGRDPDISIFSQNYAQRTEVAAANYRNTEPTFRMILPPPNVTGKLHLGHALTAVLEDALCRHHRIKGTIAHWLPGFDHAGIATQAVAERELWNERKLTRADLTREEFVEFCTKLSQKNASSITEQLKRLGATLNWKQSYYTLDQEVERVSVQPGDELLVPEPSKGGSVKRRVKFGQMHRIRYKVRDSKEFIEVGTTRPETCFADVAIAVHPEDSRYSNLIGKILEHPLVDGLFIPVIADEAVSQNKGTGAVKVTPAHDQLDFRIASRHWTEIERTVKNAKSNFCLTESGKIKSEDSEFNGLDRFEAREKVLEYLKSKGAYQGIMEHSGAQVNVCTRTGDIIEPRLMKQWFLDTVDIDKEVYDDIKQGKIKITPSFHETALLNWLSNSEPWCLSRQLLWGHRIPAYTVDDESWFVGQNSESAAQHFGTDIQNVRQDNDVLDTWFSSSLIPLVSAGWMNRDKPFDISQKPPVDLMETGWDILGFWVARMLTITKRLSGGYFPFNQIILHGLIRDANGRKMSKSLGNVIDPNDIIDGIEQQKMIDRINESQLEPKEKEKATADIKSEYPEGIPAQGVDSLRFALLKYDAQQVDIRMDVIRFSYTGTKFIAKIWNLCLYYEKICEASPTMKDVDSEHVMDRWLVSRMASTLQEVDRKMAAFEMHHAFQALIDFVKVQLSDVYVEATKSALRSNDAKRISEIRSTMQRVMQPALVQLSVFMPFISEHLYERIFHREPGSIYFDFVKTKMLTHLIDVDLEESVDFALDVLATLHLIRGRFQMTKQMPFEGILQSDSVPDGFSETLPVLKDWGKLTLSEKILSSKDSTENLPKNLLPYTISGGQGILFLKIEDSVRDEYDSLLASKLKVFQESVEKQQNEIEKFDSIIKNYSEAGKVRFLYSKRTFERFTNF
ncbi:hypothetical protein WR25_04880 isoform A [Diploscapter pachys]|uniref:valine--tRNA ligase n=1 Tax=Diploscapter pachys TaxID=2018661 RepID=A0A2A2L1L4_9BILA|nr:hypothetical protein WR25_04880 isoform A [Diploscapter pachys]